uniref:Uncharacterized protein n=1 Tax=uncultured Armatimonadetes bacterium TaxID=157466 RepID=A0A6J4JUM5_9BACT|nr:hypothetical protein AVDCRST_MAG63-4118 [uncultured Armatimonadetes bacterium]
MPDRHTRGLVQDINVRDVAAIHLVGSGLTGVPERGVTLTDRRRIGRFLSALGQAVENPAPKPANPGFPGVSADVLEIHFKPGAGRMQGPLTLPFFADWPGYTFCAEFQDALRDAGIPKGWQKPNPVQEIHEVYHGRTVVRCFPVPDTSLDGLRVEHQ